MESTWYCTSLKVPRPFVDTAKPHLLELTAVRENTILPSLSSVSKEEVKMDIYRVLGSGTSDLQQLFEGGADQDG